MARRVRKPRAKQDVLVLLTDSEQDGPFESYKDALIFAAMVGFARQKREPFEAHTEPIDLSVFSGFGNLTVIDALALIEERELTILASEYTEERLTIFEEYANGGLEVLEGLLASGERVLDRIIEVMYEESDDDEGEEGVGDLATLIEELS